MLSRVLQPLKDKGVLFYVDDIMIATANVEENQRLLEMVLTEFRKAGLTLNLRKCNFFNNSVEYLGCRVGKDGVLPGENKTNAIKSFPTPTNVRSIREFLGLTGYFRRFVPAYANIASPLYQLLKKDAVFQWTVEQERAFKILKDALTHQPILTLYDAKTEHELHCDASSYGVAGVLMQIDAEGLARPVSYFSRATTIAERKYHSFELETLAVVESLKRFRYYLLGKSFKIYTDCRSLQQAHAKRDLVPRIARWWLLIQEFQFEICFRGNTKMRHVDCLSRNPPNNAIEENILAILDERDWIAALQDRDEELRITKQVLQGVLLEDSRENDINHNYKLKNGRVYRQTKDGLKFVIPRGTRYSIIHAYHDNMGHPGIDRTVENINQNFWIPKLRDLVKKYIAACIRCCKAKRGPDETNFEMHVVERIAVPFQVIYLDHSGPFQRGIGGAEHVLLISDAFTKFVILRAVKSTNASGVIKVIKEISQYFGLPAIAVSDRGPAFTSNVYTEFCAEHGIKPALVATKTPRANGQAERCFRIVGEAIRAMINTSNGSDWVKHLPSIQWAMNCSRNRVTGKSPQELLFGFRPRNTLENLLIDALLDGDEENDKEEERINIDELRKNANEKMLNSHKKQAYHHNATHKFPRKYEVGDLVLIRWDPPAGGGSKKAMARYRGPYQIAKVLDCDRYEITDTANTQLSQKRFDSIYAADKIKPWGDPAEFEKELIDIDTCHDESGDDEARED